MNRIFKYYRSKKHGNWPTQKPNDQEMPPIDFDYELPAIPEENGKSPLQHPANAEQNCSFCGKPLGEIDFRAYSMPGSQVVATLCSNCIETYAVFCSFTRNFGIWFQDRPDYQPLKDALMRRLAGEAGTLSMKEAATAISILILKRASAKLGGCTGDRCHKTGVALSRIPRIAVVGGNAQEGIELLRLACKEIGIFFLAANRSDVASGDAYRNLVEQQSHSQSAWGEHGIVATIGFAVPNSKSAVVYFCKDESALTPGTTRIFVNEESKRPL